MDQTCTTTEIIALCERPNWNPIWSCLHAIAETCDAIALLMDSPNDEVRNHRVSGKDMIERIVPGSANFKDDLEAGKTAYIRHLCDSDDGKLPGTVSATTKEYAGYMCPHYAMPATEREAKVQGRINRARSGKWMDAPEWRSLTANLKRVLLAERLKRAA